MKQTPQDPFGNVTLLFVLLTASFILYVIGVVSPLVTFKKFLFFSDTVSLISGIYKLFINNFWSLSVILFIFSVLFPILKIIGVSMLVNDLRNKRTKNKRLYDLITLCEKWSMLDVFIVALLILNIQFNFISQVQIKFGLYAFAASVLLLMIVTAMLRRHFQD